MNEQTRGYEPPFTMSEKITNLVIEIAETAGGISGSENVSANLTLRRENRIRSIHSSLAIEQNRLSVEQVSDIVEGKRVLGPPRDIREVKNAYDAYEMLIKLNPYSIEDLLTAHKVMMGGLVDEAGRFRGKGVGVYDGERLIHAGTPPQYVPDLMRELFGWLKSSKLHPLIKSCIFHYEFEFIHPFADGNGRTGRLWHTLILAKWKEFFLWLPIETLIHERQDAYYNAINASNTAGESTIFVTFMLEIIRDSLRNLSVASNDLSRKTDAERIVDLLKQNGKYTAKSLSDVIGISQRQVQRILKALRESGKIDRTGSNRNGSWIVK